MCEWLHSSLLNTRITICYLHSDEWNHYRTSDYDHHWPARNCLLISHQLVIWQNAYCFELGSFCTLRPSFIKLLKLSFCGVRLHKCSMIIFSSYWLIVNTENSQLSEELQASLSHRHLLEFIIERCSDIAPRFAEDNFCFSSAPWLPVLHCSYSKFVSLLLFVLTFVQKLCTVLYLLTPLAWEVMHSLLSVGPFFHPSVHPSISTIYWTNWPLTLTFCVCVDHDHSSLGIDKREKLGQRPNCVQCSPKWGQFWLCYSLVYLLEVIYTVAAIWETVII